MDKQCQCKKPTPWQDAKGNQTNVCKVCQGKIITHSRPELGHLHTTMDTVLLGDLGLEPDHPFITYLVETSRENLRQRFLTWKANFVHTKN